MANRPGLSVTIAAQWVKQWDTLTQDLRYTLRTFNRSRGFAIAAVLVTALGVGANTATFSVADHVLVRSLGFPKSDEIVRLCEGPLAGGGWGCNNQLSPANYRSLVESSSSFRAWGAFNRTAFNLVGNGEPARIASVQITPDVLPILGVDPILGRWFDTTDGGLTDANSVIISHRLWQAQFAGDSGIVGSTLRLDGAPVVVVGVMPSSFSFPTQEYQLWRPLLLTADLYENRGNSFVEGVGRLKSGVSFERAAVEVQAIAVRLEREFPEANAGMGYGFFRLRDEMSPRYRTMLVALCGASLCLLLLTCANLANLLLARAAGRERELAVRAAIGAGRERLVRQMLTESTVLALVGGAVGAIVAVVAVPLLTRLVPPTLALSSTPTIDFRVFAIAAVMAAVTGLGFGLLPALRAGGVTRFDVLRAGARGTSGRQRLRTALVAVEVAVSVALLVSSGLLIRAVWRVQAVNPGLVASGVLTLKTALPSPKYDSASSRLAFYSSVLEGVRALPGVERAAYITGLPTVMTGGIAHVDIPGEAPRDANTSASWRVVSSQYFDALRIPLLRGRDVVESESELPVAVVSTSFVERYWPNVDPIGRTFQMRGELRTVVGVVGDVKVRGLERTNEPQVYLPVSQAAPGGTVYAPKDLVIRSSRSAAALLPAIRDVVHRVDPDQPLSDIRPMTGVMGEQTVTRRAQLRILIALATLALLLAGVGIHGLFAFTVAQRSKEIGVRIALGAEPSWMARMIVSEALRTAVIGVVPGILGAYAAARAMRSLLFGVPAADPWTIVVAALLCLGVAVLGCVRPAVRAARVNPISALRAD